MAEIGKLPYLHKFKLSLAEKADMEKHIIKFSSAELTVNF